MKLKIVILFLISTNFFFAQTHTRKTRSDKGKKHTHTTTYYAKKAIKPKSSSTKTNSKRKK